MLNPCRMTIPTSCQPDIILAKQKLGWQPKVTLENGLKNTIQYFKNKIPK